MPATRQGAGRERRLLRPCAKRTLGAAVVLGSFDAASHSASHAPALGRAKASLLFLGCSVFVVAGFVVLRVAPIAGYAAIAFFGLGVVIGLIQLLPNSSYLELEEHGFTICNLFRKGFLPWQEIAEFVPMTVGGSGRPMVAVRFAPGSKVSATARRFAVAIGGAEGALPDTYGRSAAELAELLNRVRAERNRL